MYKSLLLAFSLFFLGSCGSLTLRPASPMNSTMVSSINVEYGSELDDRKIAVLDRYKMKDVFIAALQSSVDAGSDSTLRITITAFRTGGYGPTTMNATAEVLDASGAVSTSVEVNSVSVMRGVAGVAQEVVDKIAAEL